MQRTCIDATISDEHDKDLRISRGDPLTSVRAGCTAPHLRHNGQSVRMLVRERPHRKLHQGSDRLPEEAET